MEAHMYPWPGKEDINWILDQVKSNVSTQISHSCHSLLSSVSKNHKFVHIGCCVLHECIQVIIASSPCIHAVHTHVRAPAHTHTHTHTHIHTHEQVVIRVRPPLPRELRGGLLRPYQCTTHVDPSGRIATISENLPAVLQV